MIAYACPLHSKRIIKITHTRPLIQMILVLYFAVNISSCSLCLQLTLYDHTKKELRKLLGRYVCGIILFAIIFFEILYQFLLLGDDFLRNVLRKHQIFFLYLKNRPYKQLNYIYIATLVIIMQCLRVQHYQKVCTST